MALGAFAPLPLRLGGSAESGWSPAQHARVCADLVALVRVAPLAVLTMSSTAGSEAWAPEEYIGQNGVGIGYWPTTSWSDTWKVKFAWDSWTDAYGVRHPINIRSALATSLEYPLWLAVETAANSVTVTMTKTDGSPPDSAKFCLAVH